MNIREATELWVQRDMIQIPMSVVEKLIKYSEYEDFFEKTPPTIGDRVSINYNGNWEEGEIFQRENENYIVELDEGGETECSEEDVEVIRDDALPMWGTMWAFKDCLDQDWSEEHLQEIADCGFRIYESEDYGYVIGIDGMGYSFYDEHWIPLYKARGLQWHDCNEAKDIYY